MARINANLAHDMRMPLQLIYSCAQMIQVELDDPAHPAGKYAEMLMRSVNELNAMLNHSLEEARDNELLLSPVDIMLRTREICSRCRLTAEEKGLKLICSGNVSSLITGLDSEKYARILLNLISNAMRFTPAGGNIRIHIQAMGDFAEISITDTGKGISPERQKRIFEKGETDGGHGLGLWISQKYARLMGGSLSVRSVPGTGSTFTLRIPIKSIAAS